MPETVHLCPLCGSPATSSFDYRLFRGFPVTNKICNNCGLVYQSPRMTETESQVFYEVEYRRLYQGQEGPNVKDLSVQRARSEVTLDFVRKYVNSSPRILDIGCSTGLLLQRFLSNYQAQGCGVEPGIIYRQYAQSLGLQVFPSLEELQFAGLPRFSLVSMMHVLEHIAAPLGYLQNLREKLLEPDGWLLLEVPNLYAHDSFEVAHFLSYSSHTLTQLVHKAGFRVVMLRAHGLPRSRLIPLYLTLLAQPDDSTTYSFKPDNLVRLKRRLGLLRRRLVERLFPAQAWLPPSKNQP